VAAVCAVVLVPALPARGATVAVGDGQLTIAATQMGRNVIDVDPNGLAYTVYDSSGPVTVGAGCVLVSTQEAVCGGMIATIRIVGGDGPDMLGLWNVKVPVVASGRDGDDLIETGAGSDEIDAGAGGDAVTASKGNDMVIGGSGDDRLVGGSGGDRLDGQDGADVLEGGDGDDPSLSGGIGGDLIDGGKGDDGLNGGTGDDALVAKQGSDAVSTGDGNDRVYMGRHSLRRLQCSRRRFGQIGPADRRCQRIPAGNASPTAWPRGGAQRQARAADVDFLALARRPGNAKFVSVDVEARKQRTARVCIRLRDRNEQLIQRFPARVHIPLGTIRNPHPSRRASFASGELKKKGCKPKRY
jgi:Ca2+-binding RTX toxin-like protein